MEKMFNIFYNTWKTSCQVCDGHSSHTNTQTHTHIKHLVRWHDDVIVCSYTRYNTMCWFNLILSSNTINITRYTYRVWTVLIRYQHRVDIIWRRYWHDICVKRYCTSTVYINICEILPIYTSGPLIVPFWNLSLDRYLGEGNIRETIYRLI